MLFVKQGKQRKRNRISEYVKSDAFQKTFVYIITLILAFSIVYNGAVPKKYNLVLGEKSAYDIIAPRDVENKIKTEKNRIAARDAVDLDMKEISSVSIRVLNDTDRFLSAITRSRQTIKTGLEEMGISNKDSSYKKQLALLQGMAMNSLTSEIKKMEIPLTEEEVRYLIIKATDAEIVTFAQDTKDLISSLMVGNITDENLTIKIDETQSAYQKKEMSQDLKNIGGRLVKVVAKPNRIVDLASTAIKKQEAYDNKNNISKITKDARIISKGDIVTEDKLKVLEDVNLLEKGFKFDFLFALGLLIVMIMLSLLLILFIRKYLIKIYKDKKELILLSVIIIIVLLMARSIVEFSPLAIPIFIASMLVAILLSPTLAIALNLILVTLISFMTNGDILFIYMSMISGTFAVFFVLKARQRSKLTLAGLGIALTNVVVIIAFGIMNRNGLQWIWYNSLIVFMNGVVSMIFTVGMLPIFETIFNAITPLKLLELSNPNQPLIKRLLMEAPGTYHHSLMVGNLAEVGTEAIHGDALLARVGAYYHDVGKLKRPNFFKENQLSDNPHDRMTANLSTLVITSHVQDGVKLAEKYKIPTAIIEIIHQHHGNTLVAYFYHKAKKIEKSMTIKEENYRYEGPCPTTKESAVVMLADSVEAAVRSMPDKTKGKIEGLIRKIIKDKLDDGQLNNCHLTLKDLDEIAKGFMRVLSGYFHEREEYPETKLDIDETKNLSFVKENEQEETLVIN